MANVQKGDKVKVHYTGKLNDGTEFDSSKGRDPLEFEAGSGQVIKGFDSALIGMEIGETKNVEIPVEMAYGPKRDDLVIQVPPTQFPADMSPQVGLQVELHNNQGGTIPAMIVDVNEENVTLDANHPLAGKDLSFEIELVDINN